jgi:heme/copper-type cytochrome/quinol oxidase subunit 2
MTTLPAVRCPLSVKSGKSGTASRRTAANGQRILAALLVIALLALPQALSACPLCYGDPSSPMAKGASNAVWFMLAIVGIVQAGFVALFFQFRKRSRELRQQRESFRLLEGGIH